MDEQIVVDAKSAATPFPHNWEHMFGSCHIAVSQRQECKSLVGVRQKLVIASSGNARITGGHSK